jgi:hypothetical protein
MGLYAALVSVTHGRGASSLTTRRDRPALHICNVVAYAMNQGFSPYPVFWRPTMTPDNRYLPCFRRAYAN